MQGTVWLDRSSRLEFWVRSDTQPYRRENIHVELRSVVLLRILHDTSNYEAHQKTRVVSYAM